MKIPFVKMQGAGNDYVYVDGFATQVEDPAAVSRSISDRHTGVGADGLILILPSTRADARMAMFNADGSEGWMCGNGLRCIGKFLFDRGRVRESMSIETRAGLLPMRVTRKDARGHAVELSVELGIPRFRRREIPMLGESEDPEAEALDVALEAGGRALRGSAVSIGNPHCVIFVDDVDRFPVAEVGARVERDALFPDRVNVEFVQVLSRRELKQRTWERGSGETLACGSGAAAAGVIARRLGRSEEEMTLHLRGGDLGVKWLGPGRPVSLTGPAVEVFEGVLEWGDGG